MKFMENGYYMKLIATDKKLTNRCKFYKEDIVILTMEYSSRLMCRYCNISPCYRYMTPNRYYSCVDWRMDII